MTLAPTSLKAYLNEVAPTLGARQIAVLEVFETREGKDFSNMELARLLDWDINRVTPRTKELRKLGILELSRVRACRVTERQVQAWRVKAQPDIVPRAVAQEPVFQQYPSHSARGLAHVVKDTGVRIACSCKGFHYRGTCKHIRKYTLDGPPPESKMSPLFT